MLILPCHCPPCWLRSRLVLVSVSRGCSSPAGASWSPAPAPPSHSWWWDWRWRTHSATASSRPRHHCLSPSQHLQHTNYFIFFALKAHALPHVFTKCLFSKLIPSKSVCWHFHLISNSLFLKIFLWKLFSKWLLGWFLCSKVSRSWTWEVAEIYDQQLLLDITTNKVYWITKLAR